MGDNPYSNSRITWYQMLLRARGKGRRENPRRAIVHHEEHEETRSQEKR
jgi:hypothetical protein